MITAYLQVQWTSIGGESVCILRGSSYPDSAFSETTYRQSHIQASIQLLQSDIFALDSCGVGIFSEKLLPA
jgi:hypothetical protein